MYPCKLCGKMARTKKQEKIGENRYRQFNQCMNLLCGHCFTTIEELRVNTSDNEQAAHRSATCDSIFPSSLPNKPYDHHQINDD